jgi:hypothetical protein
LGKRLISEPLGKVLTRGGGALNTAQNFGFFEYRPKLWVFEYRPKLCFFEYRPKLWVFEYRPKL